MILSLLAAASMAGMFVYMLCRAKMEETRRLVWLPAAACGMELLAMGLLSVTKFPVITLLLVALRTGLMFCCGVAMRRDAAMVRARRRRRAKLSRELHLALNPLRALPAAEKAPAAVSRTA